MKCYRCVAQIVFLLRGDGQGLVPVNAGTVDEEDKVYTPFDMKQVQDARGNWNFASIPKHVPHWSSCPDAVDHVMRYNTIKEIDEDLRKFHERHPSGTI